MAIIFYYEIDKLLTAALSTQRKYREELIKNQFDERNKMLDVLQFLRSFTNSPQDL
jgi:hypothetical protein